MIALCSNMDHHSFGRSPHLRPVIVKICRGSTILLFCDASDGIGSLNVVHSVLFLTTRRYDKI